MLDFDKYALKKESYCCFQNGYQLHSWVQAADHMYSVYNVVQLGPNPVQDTSKPICTGLELSIFVLRTGSQSNSGQP